MNLYVSMSVPIAEHLTARPDRDTFILCGPYPDAPGMRAYLKAAPAGWSVRIRKAQAKGKAEAVYTDPDGREVRLRSAAAWFGGAPIGPADTHALMGRLARRINKEFKREAVLPLITPAVCGMRLWREEAEDRFPPLDEGIQTLIRATCGQGREEVLTLPHVAEVPDLEYWDLRLAYPSVAEHLPIGPAIREEGGEVPLVGRVHVRVRIPSTWRHVGLLPMKEYGRRGPAFPSAPGEEFTTWIDAREARLAIANGWELQVIERLVMQEGRPLDTWVRRLLRILLQYEEAGELALAGACRRIIIQTIGDMHGRGREFERTLKGQRLEVVRIERGAHVPRAKERVSHPEWSAAVWSRCRYRLAQNLLQADREQLLGAYIDGVFLTGAAPWPRVSRVGHLRPKGQILGPLDAPQSLADLHECARLAEEGGHGLVG